MNHPEPTAAEPNPDARYRFGVVGAAMRAEYYLRIARALPDRFEVTGAVARNPDRARAFSRRWDCPTFPTIDEMLKHTRPEFVITAVNWEQNAAVTAQLVELGMPVLAETPPASTLEGLLELHALVQRRGGRVQVAEGVPLRPRHQAQLAVVAKGWLGRVTQAQISVAHGYHGIALMRKLLGIGFEHCRVTARSFSSPLVKSLGPEGTPEQETTHDSQQYLFWFDFGDRLGVMDFTFDQYWSWVRNERTLIRGDRGEIIGDTIHYLKDHKTPMRLELCPHRPDRTTIVEGYFLKGIQVGEDWVYTNPLVPANLPDDEIAGGVVMANMGKYVRTGVPFYSLADGMQDHYLYLVAQRALGAEASLATETMPWATP